MRAILISCALIYGVLSGQVATAAVGDDWSVVRGDQSPGLRYSAFIATSSGRWIASGGGGRLMISDDSGTSWRYDVIPGQDGKPLSGTVTDLVQMGGVIIGTAVSLTPSSNRFGFAFEGKTQIVSSSDNGNSWQVTPFPEPEAISTFGRFPGIFLSNLFVTPGGQLIAYGTTLLSNGFGGYFIGGLIFRQTGDSWQQMFFELGMLQSMSQTGSRLSASGFQTVVDSADGGGWNGYRLRDAQILIDGELLPFEVREGLNGSDITFLDGNYVMQTQLFRRSESNPGIFENFVLKNYILKSPNPFDGGRLWNGTELNRFYPDWLNVGGQLLSVGFQGAQTSSSGSSWTVADSSVRAGFGSVGRQGAQTVIAVGNSDEVWRSDNRGQTWTKILDQDPGPNMIQLVRIGNRLLGREGNARIWSSFDNGATWTQIADIREQTGRSGITQIRVSGDRLFAAQGETDQIITSADQGETWEVITYPRAPSTSATLLDVVIGQNGRLIIAPESRGISPPETEFFTSDDNGQTWTPRIAPLGFGATPKTGLHVGRGRIIYLMNEFASFGPELVISDDNGVTWRRENPFAGLEGLGTPINDPQTVIELVQILRTRSGRLIIRGDSGEILTSDDRGDTWVVRENRDDESSDDAFIDWTVHPIVETGNRLIAPGSRRVGGGNSNDIPIIWVSGDDGTTWRTFELEVRQSNTFLFYSGVAPDGRVVLTGGNGAVYVSEAPDVFAEQPAVAVVREGETLSLEVPRPPLDGPITATYELTPGTATAGEDYVATSGELSWGAGDMAAKTLTVETVDNDLFEPPETFSIDLGTDGDLIVAFSYRIEIRDNAPSALPGIEPLIFSPLVTQENGSTERFRVVLSRQPGSDVTLTLENDNPAEISAQPTSFTFTPENWDEPQTVQVAGQDDGVCDRDVAVALTLRASSADMAYDDLDPITVYVTNLDDDQPLFIDYFEPERAGVCR